jgi:plastocyanin
MLQQIRIRPFILFAIVTLMLVSGCGGPSNAIVGEWKATKADLVLEFFQDNTVTLAQAGRIFTGQYKYIDNENIRLDMVGDLGPRAIVLKDVSMSGDGLAFTMEGKALQLTRVTGGNTQASPPQASSNSADLLCRAWAVQSALRSNVSDPQLVGDIITFRSDGSVEFADINSNSVQTARWELIDDATKLNLSDETGKQYIAYMVSELTSTRLRLTGVPGTNDPQYSEIVLVPQEMSTITIVPPTPGPPVVSSGKSFNMNVSEFTFAPSQLTAKVSQTITIKLTNKGTVEHNLTIDELDISRNIPPNSTESITFMPRTAGTYVFYCNIAGHREAGEVGKLVVTP